MFDLDTVGGMNRAVEWTRNLFEQIAEGGKWIVPRSGTIITVHAKQKRVVINPGYAPDPSIERVIRAMGWRVEKE